MADGTNIGSIFLDLVVKDTIEKQIQAIAAKGQASAQQAFSGVEKAVEKTVDNVTVQTGKAVRKASQAVTQAGTPIASAFNKPVALAQAKLNQLEKTLESVTAKLDEARQKDFSFQIYGYVSDSNKEYANLLRQQEQLLAKLEAAEERLAIEREAAAQKSAAAVEKAALKQEQAAQRLAAAAEKAALKQKTEAQRAAEKAAAAAERSAEKREAAERKAAEAAERAAQKAVAAEEVAANRRKAIFASMWKNMLSKAGGAAKAITSKIFGIGKGFSSVEKSASRFGTRLKRIVSGALIFNGISAALRGITSYLAEAISSTGQMETALANLKGAAATAAQPIIEILTPALTALTNAAATAFSYLSRLISSFTGKSLSSMASAAKAAVNAANKAKASLAGFDEIQRLDGSDSSDSSSDYNYDYQGQSALLDSVLAAIKAGQWERVGALIAQRLNSSIAGIRWPNIQGKAKRWTQNIVATLNGLITNLDWGLLGRSLGNGLNTILLIVDTFFQEADWEALGSGLGIGLNDLFKTLDWENLGRILTDKFKSTMELLSGFVEEFEFEDLGNNLSDMLMASVKNVDWGEVGKTLSDGAIGLLTAITTFLEEINWQEIGDYIEEFLSSVDWSGIASSLFEGIGAALGGIGAMIWSIIEDEWDSFMDDWVKYTELCGGDAIAGLLTGILIGLANIGMWIWDHVFVPIWDGICSAFDIHSPSKKMAEIGINMVAGLLQGIEETWSEIVKFFADAFAPVQEAIEAIWEDGIGKTIKNAINGIISSINGMISGIVSGVNTIINALNKLSFDIPEWVPVYGGKKFGFNIATVTAPQIPYLADGGVITQPTLAMMGEYAGASNNPEIVAPQSILEETVANVMGDLAESNLAGFEAVVAVLKDILEAVLGIELDSDTVGKMANRYNQKLATSRGGL